MASIAFKYKRYINYHFRKEMARERERMMFSNEFLELIIFHFYKQSRNKASKNFYVKSVKTVLYIKII